MLDGDNLADVEFKNLVSAVDRKLASVEGILEAGADTPKLGFTSPETKSQSKSFFQKHKRRHLHSK